MNKFIESIAKFFSGILIKSIIAFAICGAFALLYMAIFGDDAELPMIGSILLLVGSIVVSNVIVNKIIDRKNK